MRTQIDDHAVTVTSELKHEQAGKPPVLRTIVWVYKRDDTRVTAAALDATTGPYVSATLHLPDTVRNQPDTCVSLHLSPQTTGEAAKVLLLALLEHDPHAAEQIVEALGAALLRAKGGPREAA